MKFRPQFPLQLCRLFFHLLLLLLLLPLLRFLSSAADDNPQTPCPVAGDEQITQRLRPIREKYDVPAMAAAIVTSRGLEKIGAVGVRKWGTNVAVTLADMWHIGSDTKIMTSTLAAKLVEQGKLQWDSKPFEVFASAASRFDPGFKDVTLLHLLSHRAGLPANLEWSKFSKKGSIREQRLAVVQEALAQPPKSAPGSEYLYSNLGYVIAGAMIEQVTGMSWESAMQQEIFRPLGMRSVGFGGLGTPGQIDQPWGHVKARKPVSDCGPAVDNPPVLGPAGRVHCSLQDWSLFIADQLRGLRGQAALLKPATYQVLVKPPFGGDYALGWGTADRSWGGGKVLNHCGCNTMYYANAWLAPERDFAILVCANLGLDAFQATDEAVAGLIHYADTSKSPSRQSNKAE
jgi:CubicO group peptidase (beta-lactamase class C family)